MQLTDDERERVALTLLDSLGKAPPEEELDEVWSAEATRRLAEWRSGVAGARPWGEVLSGVQAKLRGP